jgi:hypothetical protein
MIIVVCLLLLLIGVVIYLLCKCSKKEGYQKKRFDIHTSFKEIDEEHQEMADALDKFHQLCVKHWETEERLYQKGRMRMPKDHPHDIPALWKEHSDQHAKFISRIEQMKTDIVNHVKEYDVPQFHFGPDSTP